MVACRASKNNSILVRNIHRAITIMIMASWEGQLEPFAIALKTTEINFYHYSIPIGLLFAYPYLSGFTALTRMCHSDGLCTPPHGMGLRSVTGWDKTRYRDFWILNNGTRVPARVVIGHGMCANLGEGP